MLSTLLLASLASQTPLRGQGLLDDVSHRAFNFFWEQSPAPNYFTLDRAPNDIGAAPHEKTPASIASIGYALCAYAIGSHRNWVSREKALRRARITAEAVLEKAPQYRGWLFHWFDPSTGERMWNCEASTIDTAIFLNGLLMAEGYFKDERLSAAATKIYKRVNWQSMLDDDGSRPSAKFFSMGYVPEHKFIKGQWHDYNELMHLYLAAYVLWPAMPASSWDEWERTPVKYAGLDFFRGGPLFLHQMSQGFYDFKGRRDHLGYDYWVGSRNATLAQIAYCTENPKKFDGYGKDIWGLSACDNPDGYNANGCPVETNDNGTLAPVSATASVLFTPHESLAATEAFVTKYPESYATYGFATGINPTKKWHSPDVIGIDIGQALLNIENARDGAPHMWMMSQPRVQKAFKKIGLNKTSEGDPLKRPLQRKR